MKISTIEKYLTHLKNIKEQNITLKEYCEQNNISVQNFYNTICSIKKDPHTELTEEVLKLYNSITSDTVSESVDTNEKAEVFYDRDCNDKIISYRYNIYRKKKRPLVGSLTREEMTVICRLYSQYGDNLPAKAVSRHFPDLSVVDLKRILSAFSLYKCNSPFPRHMHEELTEEELRNIQTQERENSFLRKAEEDRIKDNEKLLKKYAQENIELKEQLRNRQNLLKSCDLEDLTPYIPEVDPAVGNILVITLSDLHIGAYNEKYGFAPIPCYDTDEIKRRLTKVIDFIYSNDCSQVVICNLGDSVDSYNKETSRGGHQLPGNINDKDMSKMYLSIMTWFFTSVKNLIDNVAYVCVGESNHDGNWGWINNIALAQRLEAMNIPSYVSDYPIDTFDIGDTSIIYLHGKDIKSQFRGFPLTLNDRTVNWFNDWMLTTDKELRQNKIVIKGDLHQFAITECNTFKYVSMPSLYGSSRYIVSNFGLTPWGVGYIKYSSDSNISYGTIND